MQRIVLMMSVMLAACNPSPTRPSAPEMPEAEITEPATDMVPLSDLAQSNLRFAHCKERWSRRMKGDEDMLRSERRAREAIALRPDLIAAGQLALEEERAEKRRLEMAEHYSQSDSEGCFG